MSSSSININTDTNISDATKVKEFKGVYPYQREYPMSDENIIGIVNEMGSVKMLDFKKNGKCGDIDIIISNLDNSKRVIFILYNYKIECEEWSQSGEIHRDYGPAKGQWYDNGGKMIKCIASVNRLQ